MTLEGIQTKLSYWNENGSAVWIHSEGTYRILVAEWRVLAVDDQGRLGMMWKPLGYGEAMQDMHAMWFSGINVVDTLVIGEWLWVEMDDDQGRHYVIETILGEAGPETSWEKWLAYRAKHADWYRTVDRNMLESAKELLDLA